MLTYFSKITRFIVLFSLVLVLVCFFQTQAMNKTMENTSNEKKIVRILHVDGDGVAAILPLVALCLIEDEIASKDKSILTYFDTFSGTSIGGVISLAFSIGKSPKSIFNLFKREFQNLFGSEETKNESILMKEMFEKFFENKMLSECVKEAFILPRQLGTEKTKIIDSFAAKTHKNKDFLIKDVAMATSVTKDPVIIQDKKEVDENTFSNGEFSLICSAIEAAEKIYPNCDLYILSLVTKDTNDYESTDVMLKMIEEGMKTEGRNFVCHRIPLFIQEKLCRKDNKANSIYALCMEGLSLLSSTNSDLSSKTLKDAIDYIVKK